MKNEKRLNMSNLVNSIYVEWHTNLTQSNFTCKMTKISNYWVIIIPLQSELRFHRNGK